MALKEIRTINVLFQISRAGVLIDDDEQDIRRGRLNSKNNQLPA